MKLFEKSLEKCSISFNVCLDRISEPHTHDFLELAYVLHGTAMHKFNGTDEKLITKGDYFIIDYRTMHSYKSIDGGDLAVMNCFFLPQFVDKSLSYCKDFQTLLQHYLIHIGSNDIQFNISDCIFHDSNGKILELLKEMIEEHKEKNIGWFEILRTKMIDLLILTARKISCNTPKDIVSNVIEQIHQNYAKNLMLKDIADEFNYSLPYLSKLFKDKTMLTFQLYLQKTRINEACRLLANTDEKVQTIAKMVGYSDIIFFSKLFKKYNGVTPKQFRQQMNKTNELKE